MIPDGWRLMRLGDVLAESRVPGSSGDCAQKLTVKLYGKGIIAKSDNRPGSANTKYFKRSAGQLIYSKLDFLNGAFGIVPESLDGYETTLDLPAFDVLSTVNPDWLIRVLTREEFYAAKRGLAKGGRKARRVNQEAFLGIEIPFPSRAEQDLISSVLSSLDASHGVAAQALAQTRRLKQALLHQLLTKGIDENGKPHTRFKKTEIGEIPEEWEVVELENAAAPSSRITYGIVQTGENVEGGIPCVRVVDMVKSEISVDTLIKTSKEISDSYSRTLLKPGDLIFALRGEIGHVSVVGQSLKGCNLTRGVALIRPRADIDSKFLAWALRSKNVRAGIMDRVNGTALKEIPLKGLRRVLVPIPPPNEQKRIQECLESSLATELAASRWVSETHSFAKAVSSDLLSGRVRVKDLKL